MIDAYGSTEGGSRDRAHAGHAAGALGVGQPGTRDPRSRRPGTECPRARFDASGRLAERRRGDRRDREHAERARPSRATGNNPEANRERTRDGIYWSGDLGYRDEQGFLYFAGRDIDWLRVDGENFAAAPVERILTRHPDVALAAVYAVPNAEVGDDVMAALVLRPGAHFESGALRARSSRRSAISAPRWRRATCASRRRCR